jgi:GAF domain-containing protein
VRTVEYIRPGVMSLGDQPLPAAVRAVRDGETVVTSGDGAGHVPASLVVPLKQHGQTIGVLGFQETEPGRVWTADEIALAEAAAYEIVQVLEGARLFQDTQQRAWREQTIGQITAQIRANTDVQDIMRTTAEELGRTLGVSRAIVRLGMSEGTLAEERDGDGAAVPSAGEEV